MRKLYEDVSKILDAEKRLNEFKVQVTGISLPNPEYTQQAVYEQRWAELLIIEQEYNGSKEEIMGIGVDTQDLDNILLAKKIEILESAESK